MISTEDFLSDDYESVITKKSNGDYYHGDYKTFEHKWHIFENIATCRICGLQIKRIKKNN